MAEYERKIKEVARIRCLHCEEYSHHKQSCLITPNVTPFCPEALAIVNEFLRLDGIEIRAHDQSLPKNPFLQDYQSSQGDLYDATHNAQQHILKAGFVKVIPKKETEVKV